MHYCIDQEPWHQGQQLNRMLPFTFIRLAADHGCLLVRSMYSMPYLGIRIVFDNVPNLQGCQGAARSNRYHLPIQHASCRAWCMVHVYVCVHVCACVLQSGA